MKQKFLFSLRTVTMFLVMCLSVGSVWGGTSTTVTYAQSSSSAVSVSSGTAPTGSSATFSNTYSTKEQLTSGKVMTLTLSGYTGKKITKIVLSMKSNKSAGAGYLDVKAGTTSLATIGSSTSGVAFNNSKWNGSYTQSYTNVTPSMSTSTYVIQKNEDVVIIIGATTSSLYCQSFTITYEDGVEDTRTAVNMTGFTTTGGVISIVKGGSLGTSVTNDQSGWTAAYTYESSNTSVATVGTDGVITAVAKGSAKITAKLNVADNDENYKAGTTTSKSVDITVTNPTHHFTFSANGTTFSEGNVAEGEAITFPTTKPADVGGKTFTGWYAGDYSDATKAPTYVTSATMGENDVTYKAVYAIAEEGDDEWVQVMELAKIVEGTYVIKNSTFVLPNTTTSSAPSAVTAPTVTSGKITGDVTDAMKWLFTSTGTTNQFYVKNSSGKYLYTIAENNGLRVGDTSDSWTFAVNTSNYFSMKSSSKNRYCAKYSSGSDWRSYTSATASNYANGGKLELYKLTPGTTYSDFCTSVTTKTLTSIEFGGSLTKTVYTEEEIFDPTGITVLATYEGQADKEDVTTQATLTYSTDPLTVSTKTVNVAASFGTKEINKDYNITVNAASTYEITASAAVGGSYTVKVGDAEAVTVPAQGDEYMSQASKTITMTSTAAQGYKVHSTPFVVKDADDASVSISKSGDNYTFTMPAKSVTIIAQYSAVYTISAASGIEHGTISFTDKDDNAITETSQGSKVKVVVNPTTGYELATLYYVKAGVVDQNDIKENKYFSMPAGNVTVTATFSPIVATGVSISGDNTVKEGKTITLTATVEPTGALVSNPEWKSSNTDIATVNATTGEVTGVKAGNVNITYEFTNAKSQTIKSADYPIEVKESIVMKFEEITNATSLNAGDVVLFVKSDGTEANGALTTDKYLQKVDIKNIAAVEEDVLPLILGGEEGAWTFSNGNGGYLSIKNGGSNNTLVWDGDNKYWTISANNSTCTITNNAYTGSSDKKYIKYNSRFSNYASTAGSLFKLYRQVVSSTVNVVSADNTKGSVALYDEEFEEEKTIGAKYTQGTKLGLNADAKDGYEFVNWTLSDDNGGASLKDATSTMAVLTVGSKAVTATANFGLKNYDIKLTQPQTSSKDPIATIFAKVNNEDVTKACAGTAVTLSYDPESVIEGYEFTEWTVFNTSTLDELEVTDNVFEMIGANVTVEAVFTEKAKYTVTVASEDDNKGVVGFEDESGSAVVFYKDATPTIYAIAEEGYAFTNWTLNDGAKTTIADATSAETTITVKDAAIITAHFEAAAAKTLTWYVNGTTTSGLKTVGSNITFSAPTSGIPTGYVFKGWSEVEVAQTQTKPAYVTSATMPNADKTYYAVMAKETKGQNTYTKLTNGSFDTNAKYAIGADYQASQYDPVVQYFFNDYGGTLDTEISWGGCCTASGTPLEFTLSGSASQLVVKTGNVYFVAAGNKAIKMSSSSSTIVLSSSGTILTKSTSGNTLFYNHNQGNGGIRWYTSGSTQNAYFYKITPGTITYSDYCTFVKAVASVIISGEPTKTTYGVGDVFDKAGIVVKAKYNDNSETTITTDPEIEWNIQPATFTAKGENVEVSVKVTYKSIESETKNYYVTVSKKTLTLTFYEGLEDITQKQVYHDADAFKLFVETPNDYNGDLSFESSETSIATVAQEYDGWYVTPIAAGQTIITVTGEETDTYNSGTATLKVIVVQHLLDPTFAFSKSSVTANLGEAFTAPTLSKSSDLTVANISWNSSKESVATVDNAGVVTIVGLGTTTITASFSGDSKYNAAETQYTLKVNDPNADVITATFLGASTKEYAVFDEVTSTKNNITYNGSCMKNKDGDIQIKKGSTGGIVVSSSNKIATRIELTFGSTYGNNVEVYGKNTPYTDHSDLQSDDARGTLLYTFVESDDPVVFELPKGYMYIAFQSANKAAYIQQISISWKEPTDNRPNLTNTIGTICLENNVKRGEYAGASFYEVDYVEYQGETPYKVHFAEVEQLEAGYPYIYAKDDDANTIYWVEGTATNTAQSKNGLVGTLEDITGWDADGNNTLSTGNKYLVKGNLFCECGVWCGLNANRAYLDLNLPNIPTQGQSQNVAKRKLVLTREQAQTPTDVVNVNANENANVIRKVIIDNQMFIIRGGKMYNASGAIVK